MSSVKSFWSAFACGIFETNSLTAKTKAFPHIHNQCMYILRFERVHLFFSFSMCIFCGERSEAFNEEGLDLHYWKECPMLKRCQHCKQVVEIANLSAHLLTECDKKEEFGLCKRCTEAIPKNDLDAHVKAKTCNRESLLRFLLI